MLAFFSVLFLGTSCTKDNPDPEPEPVGELEIRAVNTLIGSVNQDVLVNGAVKISSLSYGNSSAYVKITSGISTIGFYDTGNNSTLNFGGQANLAIGEKFSLYYFLDPNGKKSALLLDDATTAPASGKAKVRFLNINSFLNNTLSVSVAGSTSTLIPSVSYGADSNYFEVDAGSKFNFAAAGVVAGPAFDGPLLANKIYTIWIDGTSATNLNGHLVLQN